MAQSRKKSLTRDERFWHRLTIALGYRSVRDCQAGLSISDYHDWWLFDQDEPIGNREIRQQLAYIASVLYNAHRSKDSPPLVAADFMFRSPQAEEERQQDIEQNKKRNMIEMFRALALAGGPRTPRRRKKARR